MLTGKCSEIKLKSLREKSDPAVGLLTEFKNIPWFYFCIGRKQYPDPPLQILDLCDEEFPCHYFQSHYVEKICYYFRRLSKPVTYLILKGLQCILISC